MNKLEKRFWSKVDIQGENDCWEWQASTNAHGYGRVGRGYSTTLAHRVSYLLYHGEDPGELCVCHTCDNPGCVNPAHLFLGTPADNTRDMVAKGRNVNPQGIRNGNSVLNEDTINEIRKLYATGDYTQQELADQFGIVQQHISRIIRKTLWGWL